MKRSPIRQVSDKQLAKLAERQAFSRKVIAKAKTQYGNWQCKRCKDVFAHWGLIHAHHRLPLSQGGKNEMANSAALCFRCHRLVHDHGDDGLSHWSNWIIVRNEIGKPA